MAQHLTFWSEIAPWAFCRQIITGLTELLTNRLHTVGHQHEALKGPWQVAANHNAAYASAQVTTVIIGIAKQQYI